MNDEQIRKDFEEWMGDGGLSPRAIGRNSMGDYILMQTANAWEVWKAAHTHYAKSAAPVVLPPHPDTARLQHAAWRLEDLLKDDDPHAWKEARKFLERLKKEQWQEAQTQADALDAGRSDAEIVAQTEALARHLLSWRWGQVPEQPDTQMRNSENPRAQSCWQIACDIQALITYTDAENAAVEVDAEVDAERWVSESTAKPLESDGEVFVRFSDGTIGTGWASYWHGASDDFAQWSHPDPEEDRTVTHWMKPPTIDATIAAAKENK